MPSLHALQSMFQTLLAAMKKAKFSRQAIVYAASGLGSYKHEGGAQSLSCVLLGGSAFRQMTQHQQFGYQLLPRLPPAATLPASLGQ